MIDLTPIFEAILALLAALVTYKLIRGLSAHYGGAAIAARGYGQDTGVRRGAALRRGQGREKLDYVIKELEARGFTADRAAIEAAVARATRKEKSNAAA